MASNSLTVTPVAGALGAEISGIDLSEPLAADEARLEAKLAEAGADH